MAEMETNPERCVLSVLETALEAAEQALRCQYPHLSESLGKVGFGAPRVQIAAHLVLVRVIELQSLVGFYDATVAPEEHYIARVE